MVEPAGKIPVDSLETTLFDVLESHTDGIVVLSAAGEVLFVNRTAASMFGQPATELVGDALEIDINSAGGDGIAEIRIQQVNWRGAPAALIHLHDVTLLDDPEVDAFKATHDAVTGLPNRYLLDDRVSQVLARAERGERGVVLFYCELDKAHGRDCPGDWHLPDRLLQEIAQHLTRAVRPSDTTAYLGNGEFAVLCDRLDERRSRHVEARLRDAFFEALAVGDEVLPNGPQGRLGLGGRSLGCRDAARVGEEGSGAEPVADLVRSEQPRALRFWSPSTCNVPPSVAALEVLRGAPARAGTRGEDRPTLEYLRDG